MSAFIQQHSAIQRLEPFLIAIPQNRSSLDLKPFGLSIPKSNIVNPTRLSSEPFLTLLQTLDARTFGPEGMPMDRWVFYDCCYMPGAIFGFGLRANALSEKARQLFGVPTDYEGLVPYAMYIAIPMAPEGAWMGHNLASIGPMLPEEGLKGLGSVTKAIALRCFQTERFYGATQWSSKALFVHSKFGVLDLLTAYTPAHSTPQTLTYSFEATERSLLSAAGHPDVHIERPEPEQWVEASDVETMIELQDRIEAGEQFMIPTRPRRDETGIWVPVCEKPS